MIWTSACVTPEAKQGSSFIQKYIQESMVSLPEARSAFSIGIVGGGPKGLYALEELFDRGQKEAMQCEWNVYWWNSTTDFGSGPNYQVHQPEYLLINYCIGHIDAWDRNRNQGEHQLNLENWIRKFKSENQEVNPVDFASRALVGHYLQFVAMQIIYSRPQHVRLYLIPQKVRNIQSLPNEKLLIQTSQHAWAVDNVLLTTGHCYHNIPLVNVGEKPHSDKYVMNAYPVQKLDKIPPQKYVGIIGWGLTFIDVALQLTEGRGGHFDTEGNYDPSGQEPVLLPFSRNHLPIMPRGAIYGKNTYVLHYLNKNWIEEMEIIHRQRKIDFKTEIFPWLEKEIHFAYYSTLLQTREESVVEAHIQSMPEYHKFQYKDLLFPKIPRKGTLQEMYILYLEKMIAEAEKGELCSPVMAAAAVWREASSLIASWYQAGGFTGDSQEYLDKHLFGAFCRVSYGPPVENMKKIVALLKAGIIQTLWTTPVKLSYEKSENHFVMQSYEQCQHADFIIDARIARPDLERGNSGLYQNLLKKNLIKTLDNDGYCPGCAAIDKSGKVQNPKKEIPLYFYGSNTEGFLLDNDSLSRKKNNLAPHWVTQTLQQFLLFNKSDHHGY